MKTKGFTLVELLIAVLIMSVSAAIGFTVYGPSQIVSRDARRKNDLRALAVALELYKQANGRYPCANVWNLSSSATSNWINDINYNISPCQGFATNTQKALDTTYINQIPIDPSSNGGNPTTGPNKGYAYGFKSGLTGGSCPTTPAGNYYVLVTTLENANDKDANIQKTYTYCDGTKIFGDPTSVNDNGYAILSP
ncbi:type II secretion system protein [Candidatus Daviesbacteria bacterium]|nr:type II secretion system protein [Candidatus Daviesbacteria bacterium]